MSVKAYRILESTFDIETEKDCYTSSKKFSRNHSFILGGECDALVDYTSLGDYGTGEFTVKAGAILDFIASNPTSEEWDSALGRNIKAPLDPDVKAALLEDVEGKDRNDDVRYECM